MSVTVTEWGIFRASDPLTASPVGNILYATRAAARRQINNGYVEPLYWEVRGREVPATWDMT